MLDVKFRVAAEQLNRVRDLLGVLRITVIEDRPLENVVKLVERTGELIEDLLVQVEEICGGVVAAREAVEYPLDTERARHGLTASQAGFNALLGQFFLELASFEAVDEIVSLGRDRRGEWQAWAQLVDSSFKECQQALLAANAALLDCWQALAECAALAAVPVRSIGAPAIRSGGRAAQSEMEA